MKVVAVATLLLFCGLAQVQTTQGGVYTESQATRGEAPYAKACASCHGAALEGDGQAPALAGKEFDDEWSGRPLVDLFERIRVTMPADAPGTLRPSEVADVLALLLSRGRQPTGTTELPTASAALQSIRFAPPAR
jgi:mono/diheme cytochrome c family protein